MMVLDMTNTNILSIRGPNIAGLLILVLGPWWSLEVARAIFGCAGGRGCRGVRD